MRTKPSRPEGETGYTLIELIVVVALIGIFFLLVIPRFHASVFSASERKASLYIGNTVRSLKERAVQERKDYILHILLDDNAMWISHELMTEEEMLKARKTAYLLPEELRLIDIQFPVVGRQSAGQADIHFYKKGYSDKALIHIEHRREGRRSLLIEPFLAEVKIFETYVDMEDP